MSLPLITVNYLHCSVYLVPIYNTDHNYLNILRGSLNKFPDFFRMGTFIDSTHMKL